jgi:hypothetical protein
MQSELEAVLVDQFVDEAAVAPGLSLIHLHNPMR